jgi:signal peptidase I
VSRHEQEDSSESITYSGSSMNPLLKNADKVRFVPYGSNKIRPGDIVVFAIPKSRYKIIHRVTSVDSQGIRTRGDNRTKKDPWILKPDDILGRVVSFQRKSRARNLSGGPKGRLISLAIRAIITLKLAFFFFFRPIYNWLSQTSVLRRLFPLQKKTHVVAFNHPSGTELHLLLGRHIIGRLLPMGDGWQIRKPFRLFIDETSLPKEVKSEE